MSVFFPRPETLALAPGVDALVFRCDERTEVLLTVLAPGAVLEPHRHAPAQIGMALAGRFEMQVDGRTSVLEPRQCVYVAGGWAPHGARNPFREPALGLDVKRLCTEGEESSVESGFLTVIHEARFKTGLLVQYFGQPWFELMLSRIPPGGGMPQHRHENVQIGVGVEGEYLMRVADEETLFRYGQVYHAPAGVPHGARNPFDREACSVNVFFPPRYTQRWGKGPTAHPGASRTSELPGT